MGRLMTKADLIDQVVAKLEHVRTVTWSVADQVDRLCDNHEVKEVVSGEVGLIYSQLREVQALIDQLGQQESRPGT